MAPSAWIAGWRMALPMATLALPSQASASIQSALHPAGPHAATVERMWWIMAAGSVVILSFVMLLVTFALLRRRPADRDADSVPRSGSGAPLMFIYIGGIAFPLVVLTTLLVYTLMAGSNLTTAAANALRIDVVARQWWWEVHYPAENEAAGFVTANELVVPVGRPVEVHVSSPDVIHSFWVPNLAGKIDAIPGRTNRIVLQADRAGVFRGQCAEFCGLQHALMAFHVVAVPPERYEEWLQRQRTPVAKPAAVLLARGYDVFMESGCGACHTVRGTEADGRRGPDLTGVGGRQALAAGTLPNGVGPLAGWIAAADHIKRGNGMPSFNVLPGAELRALAAWLESLR